MHFACPIITPILLGRVIDSIPARTHGLHGLPHWIRVERFGLDLAAAHDADPTVEPTVACCWDADSFGPDPGRNRAGPVLLNTRKAKLLAGGLTMPERNQNER